MPQARASKASASRPCPSCGSLLRSSATNRAQKVRCPNCLQAVVLEPSAKATALPTPEAPTRTTTVPTVSAPPSSLGDFTKRGESADENAETARRIDQLEQRVAALEAALAEAQVARNRENTRLKWLPQGAEPDLSDWRANVLCHNLGTIPAHQITIQFRADDEEAWKIACWFKRVFERATWLAQGPVEAPKDWPGNGICLATTLPVPPRPAATFMAIRAAGFALHASFDPDARGDEAKLLVG